MREQDWETREAFIETVSPCSHSHLRMRAQLCRLRNLSSGRKELCRGLGRFSCTDSHFKARRGAREAVFKCALSQSTPEQGKDVAFLEFAETEDEEEKNL